MNTSTLADVTEEVTPEIEELKEAEAKLQEHTQELIHDSELPLTFEAMEPTQRDERINRLLRVIEAKSRKSQWNPRAEATPTMRWRASRELDRLMMMPAEPITLGKVKTGILWINGPFAVDFWSHRRKKPKPTKCVCACCGNKHNLKVRA